MNVYTLSHILVALLTALECVMMIRLAFLAVGKTKGRGISILYFVTEPIVMPVRLLLSRLTAVRKTSVDISLAVTLFVLVLLKYIFVCEIY